ncbi:MAG: ATP-grasp domain-containing protein [Candidatus Uhrbacteria bacterium]|nr:ATP-grasp domain-containing protein [Candidatus Uhrbacteria bacterium]
MRIAIITGGETGEREVSINSAKNVASAIGFATHETFVFPEDQSKFIESASTFDLVIPMIHGKGAEDGAVQQLCEALGLPFLFSPIDAHKIGIDKVLTKEFVDRAGIKTAKRFSRSSAVFPVFVKPRFGGSSVHTSRIESADALEIFLENVSEEMMIEEAVSGREFTVGVVEQNPGDPEALPVVQIVSQNKFFDYESKYNADHLASEICPARIDRALSRQLQDAAIAAHTLIGASHISRSDFIVTDAGEIYFLEINTIPGLTNSSLVPKMLNTANISFQRLLEKWCRDACAT